ncbi:tetratricopeptide repeat protein [Streptacidiphilus melanogenes]|uniref:tetratricopeptide repeat protein n=1 Tax=Streptacidiphilus melanogenes TaxID=411235 RepID=UPI000694371D|nr:tetratricopeptide repeat protein [Streptacidiphilus melanogenes]
MGLFGNRRREKARAELQKNYTYFCRVLAAERLRLIESDMRAARDRARAELGDDDLLTLKLWQLYAHTLGNLGRGEEAEPEFRAVAAAAGSAAETQPTRLLALTNRAAELCFLKRFAEAVTQAQEVVETAGIMPPPDDVFTRLSGLNTQAMALTGLGHAAEAEALARNALTTARDSGPVFGSLRRVLCVNLAAALNAQGRHTEALEALTEADRVLAPKVTAGGTSAIAKARATALLALDRHQEALETARAGLTAALTGFGESHTRVRELHVLLADAEARV